MKSVRAVLLATLLVAVSVVSSASTPRSDVVNALEALLPDGPTCNYICDSCGSTQHTINPAGGLAPTHQAFHTEWCASGSCADHECGGQLAWVGPFEEELDFATPDDIENFVALNADRVILNEEREALQILGCHGTVLASFPVAIDE